LKFIIVNTNNNTYTRLIVNKILEREIKIDKQLQNIESANINMQKKIDYMQAKENLMYNFNHENYVIHYLTKQI
jgi:hypothetical protein